MSLTTDENKHCIEYSNEIASSIHYYYLQLNHDLIELAKNKAKQQKKLPINHIAIDFLFIVVAFCV